LIGKTLGQYEIREPLGAGGMGEVYRAHDPNLKRDIAIKVLPEALADDPERLARLEREAHSMAALNHPNVATIHGLESADGIRFLVLELVEGDTLADWITAGPVDLDDVLRVAAQIAEGLEAAHANGIIHRDLKPANVKITPEGRVKVLDFGLAKATDAMTGAVSGSGAGTAALTHSPTITAGATEAGVLLGTAPYMSPEQAKAKTVDKRTDIWAFGCVLYEMLTGRQPFTGEDVSDTIASILKEEPNWDALPTATPIAIQSLLRRCLRKDVDRRLRDIGDVRIEIEDAITEPADALPMAHAGAIDAPLWRRATPWAVAAVATAVAVFLYTQRGTGEVATPIYSAVPVEGLSRQVGLMNFDNSPVVVSPDGDRIVYRLPRGVADARLLMRDLTTDEETPISGTEGGIRPFFSPNGEWLGFFADGYLKKVELEDGVGEPVSLCEAHSNGWAGGSWGPDDRIVWSGPSRDQMGLRHTLADGTGECGELTELDLDAGEIAHRWPQLLPTGKGVIFSAYGDRTADDADIELYSFESRNRRVITTGAFARFVPTNGPDDGHLIVARDDTLYAIPFDAELLQEMGTEMPVESGVFTARESRSGSAHFSVSDTGRLVYREALPPSPDRGVVLVDLEGVPTLLPIDAGRYQVVRYSPDGQSLALTTEEGDVVRHELATGRTDTLSRAVRGPSGVLRTAWSSLEWDPSGRNLVFATRGDPATAFSVLDLDAEGEPELLPVSGLEMYAAALLQDPARLLYYFTGSQGHGVREHLLVGDDPETVVDRAGEAAWFQLVLSADERFLAYRDGDARAVYVRDYPRSGRPQLVSTNGGVAPVWGGAPGARTLYFRHDGGFWAADITTAPNLEASVPRRLFDDPYFRAEAHMPRAYDLSPDGTTFVVIQESGEAAGAEWFRMVQNFFKILRSEAPAQR